MKQRLILKRYMKNTALKLSVLLSVLVCFLTITNACSQDKKDAKMSIKLTSSAFKEGEKIPVQYTCDGKNISPPLQWSDVPDKAKSLALLVEDPDAPGQTWIHWVLYNIPPNVTQLSEHTSSGEQLKNGAINGTSSFKKLGYGGPCPPSGTHRYFFKIYALDTVLNLKPGATKPQLIDAMKGHILAEGQLMGRYARQ
ncbi:MAG TPA: YbhB/YbcL family Raf kinase inhibitor-like protein [Balneolales bacterium]|nr:YbhB/YbcL family Raf kinase inhibitor-like protein [Balneolales bacterium]